MKKITREQAEAELKNFEVAKNEKAVFDFAVSYFKIGYEYSQIDMKYSKQKYFFLSATIFIIRLVVMLASLAVFKILLHWTDEGSCLVSVFVTIISTCDLDIAMKYFHKFEDDE